MLSKLTSRLFGSSNERQLKKYKPIIMVEYDKKICDKIFNTLKKYKYEKFFYNKFTQEIEKFKNQEIFNIFLVRDFHFL